MNSLEFFESLELELAPFTDTEVDAISASTESSWKYRLEYGIIFLFCCSLPILAALLGLIVIGSYSLSGSSLFLAGAATILCIYAAVRLTKFITMHLVIWRYRASFLRQLAAYKRARGL